jgi:hypothetical protein
MKLRATSKGLQFRNEAFVPEAPIKHHMYEQVIAFLQNDAGELQSDVVRCFAEPFPLINEKHKETRALFNAVVATWDMLRDEMMELGYIEWVVK